MLRHQIKMAWRQMVKRKGYTLINVFGLAIGLASCLLIGAYVQEELSYDRHHEHADRIFRVTYHDMVSGKHWAPIGPPVGQALEENFPQIEKAVRFIPALDGVVLRNGLKEHKEAGLMYADPTIFSVFTLPFIKGQSNTALNDPNTIVITKKMATKYFGQKDPIGQTLTLNGKYVLEVTGLVDDLPSTSHIPFDALLSMNLLYERYGEEGSEWLDQAKEYPMLYTYILLGANNSSEEIESQLPDFVDDYFSPKSEKMASDEMELVLQPLTDIHFHSHLDKELQANGNVAYVYMFMILGLLLLTLAVINFVNLSTAQSVERGTEAAVRKTLGAFRGALIGQFMWEAIIMVMISFSIAYVMTLAILPFFRDLSGQALPAHILTDPFILLAIMGGMVLIGLLAGSYPAYVLIKARTTDMLTGKKLSIRQGSQLRKSLIVVQFVFAIVLLTGATVVYKQMHYLTNSPMGFDKDQLVNVRIGPPAQDMASRQANAMRQELLKQPLISEVTFASGIPGMPFPYSQFNLINQAVNNNGVKDYEMHVVFGVDKYYTKALGLTISTGEDFTHIHGTDSTGGFLINQAAVRALNLTEEESIGKMLEWEGMEYSGPIVGVVNNFHFRSLYHNVEPLAIPLLPRYSKGQMVVRINAGNPRDAIKQIESVWKQFVPGFLFDYGFVDAQLEALYRSELRMSSVITAFTLLALFLACLGLLGLTTLMIGQRTKEIGIRKVLGQSVRQVVVMLSGEFTKLIFIAMFFAIPLAYLLVKYWFSGFAFHISLQAWFFIGSGILTLVFAMLTVGSQAIKAANKNPVEALREE